MPTGSALPPELFDRGLIAARRARVDAGPDFVTELALEDLVERFETIRRRFSKAVLTGPTLAAALPGDGATRIVARLGVVDRLEIVPTLWRADEGDMPDLPDDDYDLIVSLLDLQVVNDVPGTLVRLRRRLRPDGLFIAAAIGGRSLSELRAAWILADSRLVGGAYARVAPFMDVRDAGSLLQRAGFALPVSDTDTHAVRYADPLALMREIKGLGAANPMKQRPGRMVTPAHLAAAASAYPTDPDGRITATLELIWMSGWAPDGQ